MTGLGEDPGIRDILGDTPLEKQIDVLPVPAWQLLNTHMRNSEGNVTSAQIIVDCTTKTSMKNHFEKFHKTKSPCDIGKNLSKTKSVFKGHYTTSHKIKK